MPVTWPQPAPVTPAPAPRAQPIVSLAGLPDKPQPSGVYTQAGDTLSNPTFAPDTSLATNWNRMSAPRPKKVSDPILPLLVYNLPGENRFNTKFGKLVLANTATPSELKHWLRLFKGYFEDGRGHLCTLSTQYRACLLYTSPSPRDLSTSRMPSSA